MSYDGEKDFYMACESDKGGDIVSFFVDCEVSFRAFPAFFDFLKKRIPRFPSDNVSLYRRIDVSIALLDFTCAALNLSYKKEHHKEPIQFNTDDVANVEFESNGKLSLLKEEKVNRTPFLIEQARTYMCRWVHQSESNGAFRQQVNKLNIVTVDDSDILFNVEDKDVWFFLGSDEAGRNDTNRKEGGIVSSRV